MDHASADIRSSRMKANISVRSLQENDLPAADHIMRLAFGTFIGLPDPASFNASVSYVRTRWVADPRSAFAAEVDGELAGSNFATTWGSIGFFGPLTSHPKFWNTGVGKHLIEPAMDLFAKRGVQHAGLFTFAQSPKHLALYQKFGFWPRFLTAIMSKPVGELSQPSRMLRFSDLSTDEQEAVKRECHELTEAIYPGLNVEHEICSVSAQQLGDTILLREKDKLVGFAVCHMGEATEAGTDTCYIKFAAIRPGTRADEHFRQLLAACEAAASAKNLSRLVAGVNTARHEAYRQMLALGFRTDVQGVVMQQAGDAGYNRPGVWLLDDWR